ncbi:MAG: hypothetical protein IPK16_28270 [Anaerolineales bacterium]|nr:hypothetical protein [Anaerolineales bacterium]
MGAVAADLDGQSSEEDGDLDAGMLVSGRYRVGSTIWHNGRYVYRVEVSRRLPSAVWWPSPR